ncbi:MAG: 2,4-dihydroxyhept-2-ene-1,7-dioic acid aldolase [Candidatus Omnitrophica bacterium]|nr:2,4-dihydroxyhept-2-ene-1,7-dioic acid aldolase [Candidatus Omnitrophota bacterium]
MKKNLLKEQLKQNQLTIGSWITLSDGNTMEIMASSGFDWLAVDMEHSAITFGQAQELIRIAELCGTIPLVRVGANDPLIIKRVMDAGAYGVIVPMVNSKADAIRAVESVYYPMKGKRGVGLARAQKFGMDFEAYKQWLKDNAVVIVQIEHVDAVKHLEEILSVEGVDGSIIGPYDLSASMGFPGEFHRDEVKQAEARYLEVCRKLNKTAGAHSVPPDVNLLKQKQQQGFTFLGFSLDSYFLATMVADQLKQIKK